MSKPPLISVVIPTWNEAKYLPPCIESIKRQSVNDFEVVIVDKNSTDGTAQLCQSAGWKIIKQRTPGISAARAEGFAAASADIIASTNADTAVNPKWLENILAAFSDPSVVCVYGPVYFLEGQHSFFYRLMGWLGFLFFYFNHLMGNYHTIGENFAVRKTAYHQIGGYNLNLPTAEDVDIGYRIKKTGKVIFLPKNFALTSNRRLAKEKLKFFLHHFENFIRLKFFGTASSDFRPIR